ncbi:hypothetical protein CCP3SC1AL1_720002 [Gammaproteobacteria bacterium]
MPDSAVGHLRTQVLAYQSCDFEIFLEDSKTVSISGEDFLATLPLKPPPAIRLRGLRAAVAQAVRKGRSPDQWSLCLLRGSGWVVFDDVPAEYALGSVKSTPLIHDPNFLERYLSALEARGNLLGGRVLLYSYLRNYPIGRDCLEPIRLTLFRMLTCGESFSTEVRRIFLEHYGLLAQDGPACLTKHLLESDIGLLLNAVGLSEELSRGRFVEAIWSHLANETHSVESPALRVLLALALDSGTQGSVSKPSSVLRFPERKKEFAQSVLLPWAGRGADLPLGIRNLLLAHLGDPRKTFKKTKNNPWKGVSEIACTVIRQSLAGEVLKDFFTLLEVLAGRDLEIDRNRVQQHAFWENSRQRGELTDAWIALGPALLSEASRCLGESAGQYAVLGTPIETRTRQAVLLIRISGTTMLKWSNSSACYAWPPADEVAPLFYQSRYTYESLERGAGQVRCLELDRIRGSLG